MADIEIEWLTPDEFENLSENEREIYERRYFELLQNSDVEDENCGYLTDDEEQPSAFCSENIEHSDAESIEMPEFNPIDTDSDYDGDECNEFNEATNGYIAKDHTIWSNEPPMHRKMLAHNILRSSASGPKRKTEGLSMFHTFKLIMSPEMCDVVIRETNRKAKQHFDQLQLKNPSAACRSMNPLTRSEFDAYLGILLLAGATHSKNVPSQDLWKTNSHPLFRAAMSLRRFWEINRYIRFDNGRTRDERKKSDKAAAISDIFGMLNSNLQSSYVAGPSVTVDEQLFPYRGGTGFTQYMPSKPAKYGIKVWWVCDAVSSYPINGQIYTGMAPSGQRERNQGERVVKELCNRFRGSGRTVICDNFFTSYNLAISLMLDYKLALLGTVNKRRTFVPTCFANPNGREIQSTLFAFSSNVTMCSYIPKKKQVCSSLIYTTFR